MAVSGMSGFPSSAVLTGIVRCRLRMSLEMADPTWDRVEEDDDRGMKIRGEPSNDP